MFRECKGVGMLIPERRHHGAHRLRFTERQKNIVRKVAVTQGKCDLPYYVNGATGEYASGHKA